MSDAERGHLPGTQAIADAVNAGVKAERGRIPDTHRCDSCMAVYTTEVNLRAHQYRMHPRANLGLASTKELLNELIIRLEMAHRDANAAILKDVQASLPERVLAHRPVTQR